MNSLTPESAIDQDVALYFGSVSPTFCRLHDVLGKFSIPGVRTAFDPLLRSRREIVLQIIMLVNNPSDLKVSIAALRVLHRLSKMPDFSSAGAIPNRLYSLIESSSRLDDVMNVFVTRLSLEVFDDRPTDVCAEDFFAHGKLTNVARLMILDYLTENAKDPAYNVAHFLLGFDPYFQRADRWPVNCLDLIVEIFTHSLLYEDGSIYTRHPMFALNSWIMLSQLSNDQRFTSAVHALLCSTSSNLLLQHLSFVSSMEFREPFWVSMHSFMLEVSASVMFANDGQHLTSLKSYILTHAHSFLRYYQEHNVEEDCLRRMLLCFQVISVNDSTAGQFFNFYGDLSSSLRQFIQPMPISSSLKGTLERIVALLGRGTASPPSAPLRAEASLACLQEELSLLKDSSRASVDHARALAASRVAKTLLDDLVDARLQDAAATHVGHGSSSHRKILADVLYLCEHVDVVDCNAEVVIDLSLDISLLFMLLPARNDYAQVLSRILVSCVGLCKSFLGSVGLLSKLHACLFTFKSAPPCLTLLGFHSLECDHSVLLGLLLQSEDRGVVEECIEAEVIQRLHSSADPQEVAGLYRSYLASATSDAHRKFRRQIEFIVANKMSL